MKIVILCPYSHPSACGIWSRVNSDAEALRDAGHDVYIFSSNIIKGTNERSSNYENTNGLEFHRFRVWFKLGGTSMFWFFGKKLLQIKPDVIHTHGYRHPHSIQALLLGKILRKKVLITTHGPFEKDPNRNSLLKVIDTIYDRLIGFWELRSYNVVIRISKWEEKYLKKFKVKNSILIPNGIKHTFLDTEVLEKEPQNQVIYMGRIDPVKRLEWIEYASYKLPNIKFKIKGPIQGYESFESELPNLNIENKKYTSEDFITELDNSDIFVLPSIRESFGIVLIEAMSRGKIVITSDTKGGEELVLNGENGFIVLNEDELVEAIEYTYKNWNKLDTIRKKAIKTAQKYDERITTKKLIELYNSL